MHDKSLESSNNATELDPDSFMAYNNLGSFAQAEGNFEESIKYYRMSLAKKTNASAFFGIATAFDNLSVLESGDINDVNSALTDSAMTYFLKSAKIASFNVMMDNQQSFSENYHHLIGLIIIRRLKNYLMIMAL